MADILKARSTQAKVKHTILEKYIKSWGNIIINGMIHWAKTAALRGRPFEVHFVYVDCNAFAGRYSGQVGETPNASNQRVIYGSPIIGVQALDVIAQRGKTLGVPLRTSAICIEIKRGEFGELKQSMEMAGYGERVKETTDFTSLRDGEIALVNADSTALVDLLLHYTQAKNTYSIYFLDPFGPEGIPLDFVGKIINSDRHDVIINMPYQDLHKKTGYLTKTNPTQAERLHLAHYDEMFGDDAWRGILKEAEEEDLWEFLDWSSGEEEEQFQPMPVNPKDRLLGPPTIYPTEERDRRERAEEIETSLFNMYWDSLVRVAPNITPKSIRLRFPDRERTVY